MYFKDCDDQDDDHYDDHDQDDDHYDDYDQDDDHNDDHDEDDDHYDDHDEDDDHYDDDENVIKVDVCGPLKSRAAVHLLQHCHSIQPSSFSFFEDDNRMTIIILI